ncbi:MAG: phage virion morphogenesis protein [Microcoleus sp.]
MTSIKITIQIPELEAAITRIVQAIEQPKPVFDRYGPYLLDEIENRFVTETDPDGDKWADLKPATWKRKKSTQILTETRRLRESFGYMAEDDGLSVGTPVNYAATHQFGAEIQVQPREQEVYFKLGKDGRPGQRFSKKRRSNFAQKGRVGAYTIKIPARPILGINERDIDKFVDLFADHLVNAALS